MTKTKNKVKNEAKPRANAAVASVSSESYKATESGFVLVKKTRSGITEIPLSNFDAKIIAELVTVDDKGDKRVDGVVVETRFGDWTKTGTVPASVWAFPTDDYTNAGNFDERLLKFALSIHPMASVMPNKEKHVVAAIKTVSKPRTIVKEKENNKTINRKA